MEQCPPHPRDNTRVSSEGAKVYEINGPLFFGSADGFAELFEVADRSRRCDR